MKRWVPFTLFLMVIISAFPAKAAILQVTTPAELQSALNTARNNGQSDTIRVAQGTYVGSFQYEGAAGENFDLTLEGGWSTDFLSRTLDPANTILDGNHAGMVLFITNQASHASGNVTVEGFTIRNGSEPLNNPGGLKVGAWPPGAVTIRRNIIERNVSGGVGAGFIVQNTDSSSHAAGPAYIKDNIIRENVSGPAGPGVNAGGDVFGGDAVVVNNLIYGNTAGANPSLWGYCGGLSLYVWVGNAYVINNTITGNTAYTRGGGICIAGSDWGPIHLSLNNNIIWGNNATTGNGADILLGFDTGLDPGNTLTIAHNDFHDLAVEPGWTAPILLNNIDADPRFLNSADPNPANWDLRLQPDSPCIDTGDNAAPALPATDLTGKARIIDGDGNGSGLVDMGAHERDVLSIVYRVTPTSDSDCSDRNCNLQSALNAAAADGNNSIIRLARGTYTGNFTYSGAPGEDYGLVLEGGWNSDFSSRTVDPANTILDGSRTGRVLSVDNRANSTSGDVTVEGLTMRNGLSLGVSGGGLLVAALPPGTITINRNIFEGNESDYSAGGLIAINREPGTSNGGPMIVSNNILRNNVCGSGIAASGGAAYLYNTGTLSLFNNLVYGNQARGTSVLEGSAGGIVVVTYAGDMNMVNNTFTGNQAHTQAGGLYVLEAGDAWAVSNVRLHNNIIRGNTSGSGPSDDDILNKISATLPAPGNILTIAHTNVGLLTSDAGAVNPTLTGNINADPLFLNAADPNPANWDLRLRYGSPCVDAGNSGAPGIPATDLLGNGRALDGNGDGTPVADMGAYELALSMEPAEGTIGTEVTLTLPGGGFGAAAAKVYLEVTDPVTRKTKLVPFQTLNWADASVQARWMKKVLEGEYPLVVKPKAKDLAPIRMGSFRVQLPTATFGTRVASAGAEITILGRFFGTKKPKVYLAFRDGSGKRKTCKVLNSTMDALTGGSTLVFVVPKLDPDVYDLKIVNTIGSSGPDEHFWVLP